FSKGGEAGQDGADGSRLLKPLRLELKQGCLDKAAAGGLAAYAARWGGSLGARFKDYAKLAPAARKTMVEEALSTLESSPLPTSAPPPKGEAAPAPRAGAGELRAGEAGKIRPSDPVSILSALGPKRSAALRAMGIHSIEDLLYHSPRAWQDR